MKMKKVILSFLVLSLTIPGFFLSAGTLKGVNMEDSITVDGQDMVLNGMALRKKIVFKVYVCGLYLPQKESDGEKILNGDTHRKVIMHFVRTVGAKKINAAWLEGLEDNTPNASAELKKQFDTLCHYMEKIPDGNRIIFTYIPGKGTTVEVNGKNKGVIEGKPFADALFACWIGPEPGPGKGFKKNLLGL